MPMSDKSVVKQKIRRYQSHFIWFLSPKKHTALGQMRLSAMGFVNAKQLVDGNDRIE